MARGPTERTLNYCRRQGWTPAVVEKWNPHARIRQDLFGGIDVLAIGCCVGVLGIQSTTRGHIAARVRKLTALPAMKVWLAAGNELEVWGWDQPGGKGSRWRLKRVAAHLEPDGLKWLDVYEPAATAT